MDCYLPVYFNTCSQNSNGFTHQEILTIFTACVRIPLEDKKKTKAMLLEVKALLSNSQDLLQEVDLVLTERGKLP